MNFARIRSAWMTRWGSLDGTTTISSGRPERSAPKIEQAQFPVVLLLDVSERRADRVQDVGVFQAVFSGAIRYLHSVIKC